MNAVDPTPTPAWFDKLSRGLREVAVLLADDGFSSGRALQAAYTTKYGEDILRRALEQRLQRLRTAAGVRSTAELVTVCESAVRKAISNPPAENFLEYPNVSAELVRWLRVLYEPLVLKAGGQLLDRRAYAYPVAFFPANGRDIDDVLPEANVRLDKRINPEAIRTNPRYRRQRHGLPLDASPEQEFATTQGDNLCMASMKLDGGGAPRLTAIVGTYGQLIDSSDAMIDEALAAFSNGLTYSASGASAEDLLKALPLRRHVHGGPNPFQSGARRAAGIGVASLVAFMSGNDHVFHGIIGVRSGKVSTWRNTWHVFPSGMLGTRFVQFERGYKSTDVARGTMAEFAEELYSRKDAGADTSRDTVDLDEHVRYVMRNGRAQLVFTGIAFDLLNLRPEICSVLIVSNPAWFPSSRLEPNYEVRGQVFRTFPALDYDEPGLQYLRPEITVPSGAAAFWAGVDVVRKLTIPAPGPTIRAVSAAHRPSRRHRR